MHFFRFQSECVTCQEVLISVDPLGDGDVDLFVNYFPDGSNTTLPVLYHSQYFSSRVGPDDIIIRKNSSTSHSAYQDVAHDQPSLRGHYFIGVYGFRNSTYQLVVTQGNFNILRLYPGVSSRALHISPSALLYYQLFIY